MRKNVMMTLSVIVVIALAAPAAEAQHGRHGRNDRWAYGPPGGWTMDGVRNTQSIVPNLLANYDLQMAKNDYVYRPGQYSRSTERLQRWRDVGQPGAWEYNSGAYGGYNGYGQMPHMNGFSGYSGAYGLPMYQDNWGVGMYGQFNGYGPGFLDYHQNQWQYYGQDGRRHRLATRGEVRGWGIANLAMGGVNLIHNIVSERRSNKRQEEIRDALRQMAELQMQQQQMVMASYQQPPPTYQSAPVQPERTPVPSAQLTQTQPVEGYLVINPTGCHIKLVEADGSRVVSEPGYPSRVRSLDQLQAEAIGAPACDPGYTEMQDRTIVLDCGK